MTPGERVLGCRALSGVDFLTDFAIVGYRGTVTFLPRGSREKAWQWELSPVKPQLSRPKEMEVQRWKISFTAVFLVLKRQNRASPEEAFSASLYQMELDRLRYSLSKYLRTRLRKVERDALHVLASADGEMEGRLSDR